MRKFVMTAAVLSTLVALATPSCAQDRRGNRDDRDTQRDEHAFEWSGDLARGQRLYVYDISGNITVERTRGSKVEIVASKKWRRGHPEDVVVSARRVRGDRDVVVCAVWRQHSMDCDENGYRSHDKGNWGDDHNDVQVDFTIKLPAGAHITANTITGDVEVTGASGDVNAMTITGHIDAESSDGTVEAKTVTGAIRVHMGRLPARDVSYHTVTGSITLSLPDRADADINAHTVMGGITSDFPITVGGNSRRDGFTSHTIQGRIGRGGTRIELETVTGPIHLEKSGSSAMR